ncbi:hypothetical protein Thiowin_00200 [Thiorhodovibrio winogradskyi]|uniref:Uncharacterized protein n=1 Tax=Thiorhodovibrio winogradskyi TaxID=77007 RepID=A0ABZ0S524_9GAMM
MKKFQSKVTPEAMSCLQPTANNVVVRFPSAMLERMRASSTEEARARYARLFETPEPADQPSSP